MRTTNEEGAALLYTAQMATLLSRVWYAGMKVLLPGLPFRFMVGLLRLPSVSSAGASFSGLEDAARVTDQQKQYCATL